MAVDPQTNPQQKNLMDPGNILTGNQTAGMTQAQINEAIKDALAEHRDSQKALEQQPIRSWTQVAAGVLDSVGQLKRRRELQAAQQQGTPQPLQKLDEGGGSGTPSSGGSSGGTGSEKTSALDLPTGGSGSINSKPPDVNDRSIPASIRNNNPGAMWPGPSAARFGSTGTQDLPKGQKIATFSDPINGGAALFDLAARNYTGMTLGQFVNKWGGGHDPAGYAQVIAQRTGLSPNTVITPEMMKNPKIAVPLAQAMAYHEAGKPYPLSTDQWTQAHSRAFGNQAYKPVAPAPQPGQAPQGAPAMTPAMAAPGARTSMLTPPNAPMGQGVPPAPTMPPRSPMPQPPAGMTPSVMPPQAGGFGAGATPPPMSPTGYPGGPPRQASPAGTFLGQMGQPPGMGQPPAAQPPSGMPAPPPTPPPGAMASLGGGGAGQPQPSTPFHPTSPNSSPGSVAQVPSLQAPLGSPAIPSASPTAPDRVAQAAPQPSQGSEFPKSFPPDPRARSFYNSEVDRINGLRVRYPEQFQAESDKLRQLRAFGEKNIGGRIYTGNNVDGWTDSGRIEPREAVDLPVDITGVGTFHNRNKPIYDKNGDIIGYKELPVEGTAGAKSGGAPEPNKLTVKNDDTPQMKAIKEHINQTEGDRPKYPGSNSNRESLINYGTDLAEYKRSAETFQKEADKIANSGYLANDRLSQLKILDKVLEHADENKLKTGRATDKLDYLNSLAATLFGTSDDMSVWRQVADKIASNQQVGDIRDTNVGQGVAVREVEAGAIRNSQFNLDKQLGANRAVIRMQERALERELEHAQFANAYIKRHNRLDNGFNEARTEYFRKNPFMSDPELNRYKDLIKPGEREEGKVLPKEAAPTHSKEDIEKEMKRRGIK